MDWEGDQGDWALSGIKNEKARQKAKYEAGWATTATLSGCIKYSVLNFLHQIVVTILYFSSL